MDEIFELPVFDGVPEDESDNQTVFRPFDQLPSDLFSMIIHHVLSHVHSTQYEQSLTALKRLYQLRRVRRIWRDTIDNDALLWTFIDSKASIQLVAHALHISGTAPLSIRYRLTTDAEKAFLFTEAIAPHIRRWKKAILSPKFWDNLPLIPPQILANNIENLTLIGRIEPQIPTWLFAAHGQTLQTLTMNDAIFSNGPIPVFGQDLRSLTIHHKYLDEITYPQIRQLLALHPSLVELKLEVEDFIHLPPAYLLPLGINLPNLRSFTYTERGYHVGPPLRLLQDISAVNISSFLIRIKSKIYPETALLLLQTLETYLTSIVAQLSTGSSLKLLITFDRGVQVSIVPHQNSPQNEVCFGLHLSHGSLREVCLTWLGEVIANHRLNITRLALFKHTGPAVEEKLLSKLLSTLVSLTELYMQGSMPGLWTTIGKPVLEGTSSRWLLPKLERLSWQQYNATAKDVECYLTMTLARDAAAKGPQLWQVANWKKLQSMTPKKVQWSCKPYLPPEKRNCDRPTDRLVTLLWS